jgi:hypothetical protein
LTSLSQGNFLDNCKLLETISDAPLETQDILLELIYAYCDNHGILASFLTLGIHKEVTATGKSEGNISHSQNTVRPETLFREDFACKSIMRCMFSQENRQFLCQHLPLLLELLSKSGEYLNGLSTRSSFTVREYFYYHKRFQERNPTLEPIEAFLDKFVDSAEKCPM